MKKINYKSDFDFKMKLKDCEEKAVPFPDCDWDAVFWTSSKANAYKASCKGGVYANCRREEDGSMRFIFDNQRLGPGSLKWEPHFELPNGIYPSGIQDLFDKKSLDIELVTGAGDYPTTAEVEASLPLIKGEPFTYDDFTPEQIADLKRPATEAAERADKAVRAAEKATQEAVASNKQLAGNVAEAAGAETERVEAETARVTAETQRQSAEDTRKANEVERVKAEGLRDSNEATRESQEAERQSAETDRINAEKARVSAEASRVAAETKRASDFTEAEAQRQSTFESAEAERAQAEATRVSNENIRIGNEQSRVNAEHTRASQETARQDAENARQSNEQSRVTAEGARVEAENARAIEFAGFAATIAAKQDKLITTEDLSLSEENELSLTDMAKKRLFNDMWDAAFGEYGKYDPANAPDAEHPYLGNGIWMTYEEAVNVYNASSNTLNNGYSASNLYSRMGLRTALPLRCQIDKTDWYQAFYSCRSLEVVAGNFIVYNGTRMFCWCDKLKEIIGSINLSNSNMRVPDMFQMCKSLETVVIKDINGNISFSDSPLLKYESVKGFIDNRSSRYTSPITITVHPAVYAKLTGDTTNAAAAALTDEEAAAWQGLVTAAAAKNISFATV